MINTYASVEDEEWTSDYRPCGIERDCMNASIIDRNNVIKNSVETHYNNMNKNIHSNPIIPQLSNDNRINQIQFNRFNTAPFKNGKKIINRGEELGIKLGEPTTDKRSSNVLSEVSIDNFFTPLVPEMIDNLNGHNNIYTYSRVGINTRNINNNNIYLNKCIKNIKNINKNVLKEQ